MYTVPKGTGNTLFPLFYPYKVPKGTTNSVEPFILQENAGI